jgi:exosortase
MSEPKSSRAPMDWRSLLLLMPSFIAMAWLVSRAKWFWTNNPDLQFGWVVALLCGYLFWEAWEARPAVDTRLRWWTITVAGVSATFLLIVQSYWAVFGTHASTMMGLAMGILGLCMANVGLVFGWPGIRRFAIAYLFILVAMPLPGAVHSLVVGGLQSKVAWVNTEVLNLLGIPATQVGSLIHLPSGTVGVDEACSGIRSLQSTVMATLFIGYLTLRHVSMQILLLVCGIGLAIFGNLVRSLYLSLTANAKGVEAIAGVHDAAGWSILAFTAVGVILISWFFNKIERRVNALQTPEAPPVEPEPKP